jgi:hypothetical protein
MRTRRRARAILLWGAVSFAALQLGLTAATEFGLTALRDPYYAHKSAALRRRLRQPVAAPGGPRPRVVVVLGSSRVSDGLRGRAAEEELQRRLGGPVVLFNFGFPAEGPMHELLHFERLLAEGIRPDLVVVEVLPPYLHELATKHLPFIAAERLGLRDWAVLARYGMPVDRLTRYSWLCWAAPWYAHRLEILTALMPRLLPGPCRQDWARGADPSGWVATSYQSTPENRRRAVEKALEGYGWELQHYRLGNPFCPALAEILGRCRRERIAAALLLMPEGAPFRALYSADAGRQIDTFLAGLSAEHGAPIIDARDWMGDDDFFDAHHLLPEAAAAFTSRLGRQAILPLLRGPS